MRLSAMASQDASQSTVELTHVRKRATLACHQCRSRKVKCSLMDTGIPCRNCQLDEVVCTTSLSKRTRKYRLQKAELHHSSANRSALLPRTQSQHFTPSSMSPTGERMAVTAQDFSSPPDREQTSAGSRISVADASELQPLPIHNPRPSAQDKLPAALPVVPHGAVLELPTYIRRPQHCLKPQELAYLEQRGAFSIPHTALSEQLLLAFVLYVNPFLPVIDLQEFIDGVEGKPGCEISLILFQAVMFAGTAFVDLQYLLDAGFHNRVTARAYFYEKIKVSSVGRITLYILVSWSAYISHVAPLRFWLGDRSSHLNPSHFTACILVCVKQRPEGSLALDGYLYNTSYGHRSQLGEYTRFPRCSNKPSLEKNLVDMHL